MDIAASAPAFDGQPGSVPEKGDGLALKRQDAFVLEEDDSFLGRYPGELAVEELPLGCLRATLPVDA